MQTTFDSEAYTHINQAGEKWLRKVLKDLPSEIHLSTALDLGCGAGFYSGVLHGMGYQVTGLDLRIENVEECRSRFPDCVFDTIDLDQGDPHIKKFDLVLLFGLLYHLQSPLRVISQISKSIGKIGVVSTRVASGQKAALYLHKEGIGREHSNIYVSAVPTLTALVAIFKSAGFDYIYYPSYQPDHYQWKVPINGQRHNFIVSRYPILVPQWEILRAPHIPGKWDAINSLDRILKPFGALGWWLGKRKFHRLI